jgi:hypothetical protein
MRNRAKCKLCNETVESFTIGDYVECKCGEIAIAGGLDKLITWAKDYKNFLRVDDLGNEIVVKYDEHKEKDENELPSKFNRKDMIDMLDNMATNIERLPQHAMTAPITHADHCALIMLLVAIMRSQD